MPLYFNWRKEFCKVIRCQWEKGSSFSISIYDGLKNPGWEEKRTEVEHNDINNGR
jgi:hypothetical protein